MIRLLLAKSHSINASTQMSYLNKFGETSSGTHDQQQRIHFAKDVFHEIDQLLTSLIYGKS